VLFEINLDGSNLQALPEFEFGCHADGFLGSVIISASDHNLWVGSDPGFGSSQPGAVWALSPTSGLPLKSFPFDGANGSGLIDELKQAKDGTLYGAANAGGMVSKGTPDGVIFSLHAGLPPPSE